MALTYLTSCSAALADAAASLSAGYTCKETQGALLVLQSAASAETVFESRILKAYMIRHHEHWHAYARDILGHDIGLEEIILVSGWVKHSADWAATAFSSSSLRHFASLQGSLGKLVGLELFRSRTRVQSGPRMHRQGSAYPRPPEDMLTEKDQCMFLKRYKIESRLKVLKTIVAGAGHPALPKDGEGGVGEGGVTADGMMHAGEPDDWDALFSQQRVSQITDREVDGL